MITKHTYKFIKNGIISFLCNTDIIPDGEILATIDVLNAEKGKLLINKITGKTNNVIPLVNGDTEDNYKEIEE